MTINYRGGTYTVNRAELVTVKEIVSDFFNTIREGGQKVGSPTFYITFLIWVNVFSGELLALQMSDQKSFKENLEAIEKSRKQAARRSRAIKAKK